MIWTGNLCFLGTCNAYCYRVNPLNHFAPYIPRYTKIIRNNKYNYCILMSSILDRHTFLSRHSCGTPFAAISLFTSSIHVFQGLPIFFSWTLPYKRTPPPPSIAFYHFYVSIPLKIPGFNIIQNILFLSMLFLIQPLGKYCILGMKFYLYCCFIVKVSAQ